MKQFVKQVMKVLAFVCMLWFPCSGTVFAGELKDGSQRVFDYAGLFEEEEAARLEEKTAQFRETMKVEAIVLTVEDANGQSAPYTADQFYFDHGFSESFHENGIVVLIDMDNRELYLGTYGSMIRILTDERIEDILDDMYDAASQGDYGDAAMAGLDGAQYYFKKGIASNQYNYDVETGEISVHRSIRWYEALFALIVSTGAAAGVCLSVVRQYGMKENTDVNNRLAYRADCRFQFQNPSDQLLHTAVSHMVIPRQPPRGGGGGFGGGSSGRSSTHSYGGHRAGGGGRKF